MANAKVVNGFLVPDLEDVRAVLKQLREDMRADPALAAEFAADPRAVLGARGINRDIQTEYLEEQTCLAPTCIRTITTEK